MIKIITIPPIFTQFSLFFTQIICLCLAILAIECSGDQSIEQTMALRYPKQIQPINYHIGVYNKNKESVPTAINNLLGGLIMIGEFMDIKQLDSLEEMTDQSNFSILDSIHFNLFKGIICRKRVKYPKADSLLKWVYIHRDLLHPSDRAYLLDELGIIGLHFYKEGYDEYFREEYACLYEGDFTYPSTKNYFYSQAVIQKNLLDFDLALKYAESATYYLGKENFPDSSFLGKCLNLLANIHFENKEYEPARVKYRESLQLASKNSISTIKENLARCLVYVDSLDEAEKLILENIRDKERLQKSYNILGLISIDRGDYREAIDAYNLSLRHTLKRDLILKVEAWRGMGIAKYELGEFDESIKDFEACLMWIDDGITKTTSMNSLERYLIESIRTHAWIAVNHMEKEHRNNGSDYQKFLHHYALIDSMLILSKQLVHENLQRSLSNEYKQIFIAGINRLLKIKKLGSSSELHRIIDNRILKWFDHNKSTSLHQHREAILNKSGVNNESISALLSLQSNLLNIYNRSLQGNSYSTIRKLKDSIAAIKPFPINQASFNINNIQNALSKEDAVLAYLQSRDKFYTYLLTKDTLHIDYIQQDSFTQSTIEQYKELVSNEPQSSKSNSYDPLARNLYNYLLGKFSEELKQKKNWYVLGDGLLDNFPFESLICPDDPAAEFAKYNYLVYKHKIINGFSLRLLLDHLNPDTIECTSINILSGGTKANGFDKEKQYIKDIVKKQRPPILVKEATSKDAYKNVIQDYGVTHIVSHAYVDPASISNSYILIGTDTIYMGDIYAIPVESNLVVLSACNTHQGAYYSGEGVYSFARLFYMLGARHIVSTTWAVPINHVPEIIGNFYQGLFEGEAINTALYNSKLQYLNQADFMRVHPYYWAGINSYGDPLVFN